MDLDDSRTIAAKVNYIFPSHLKPLSSTILHHAETHNYTSNYTAEQLMEINFTSPMTGLSSVPSSTKTPPKTQNSDVQSSNVQSSNMGWTNHDPDPTQTTTSPDDAAKKPQPQLTALQQHVLFWDRDNDGIIWPWDVYNGFRALGFNILFSIGSLLIPIFFSYPTTLAHSWIPDPWLRIDVANIHKAKHGSDTGVFDIDGHFHGDRFDAMFDRWDEANCGGLSADEMWHMWKKNRCAADVAGWCFAFMELWTTWLLLQRNGRVWKDDLRGCYDGTLFWKISEDVSMRKKGGTGWDKGYGVGDFFDGVCRLGTWRNWEAKKLD